MKRLSVLLLMLFVVFQTFAQDSLAIEKSGKLSKAFFDDNKLPGMSVTIAKKGAIVYSEGFGYADLENEVPVDPAKSKFRIGSVSKPFTAAALAVLFENGKINLDTNIHVYVPEFPNKKRKKHVTLRLTAGHLAGIRHYKKGEFLSAQNYPTVRQGLDIFKDDTLLHKPGSKYTYSSYGWNLISAAVETAAEEDFLAYIQRVVFDSLQMSNTQADHNDRIINGRTRFYVKDKEGNFKNAPYVDNSYKWAGGGFLSTTEDLMKFGQAHLKPGYLKKETLEEFFRSQTTKRGEKTNYGMGWATYERDNGINYYGHSGGSVGGSTIFIFYPEQEIVVAVVSNLSSVQYGDLAFQLLELFVE